MPSTSAILDSSEDRHVSIQGDARTPTSSFGSRASPAGDLVSPPVASASLASILEALRGSLADSISVSTWPLARGEIRGDDRKTKGRGLAIRMRQFGKSVILAAWLSSLGAEGYSQTVPIEVEIATAKTQARIGESFVVFTAIRNTGRDGQKLWIWSCSYPEQWTSDNPDVHIDDVPCLKNDAFQMNLAPGKTYERQLEIHIDAAVEPRARKPITFRLRFESAIPDGPTPALRLWSNAITLNVTG